MLTLTEVKSWLNKTDTARDDELEALMNRAIEAVQRTLDWYFGAPRDTEEVLDGTGVAAIWLRQPPVNGLVVSKRTGPTEDWTVVDAEDYEVDGRGVFHDSIWLWGCRNYRFEYQEGFVQPPGDVQQFTLDLIKAKWNEPQIQGVVSETLGRYSYTLGDLENTAGWPNVVANWKRGRV